MNREQILIVLGVLTLISPWSGLPLAWLTWILPVLGLAVVGIGLTIYRRNKTEHIPLEAPVQHQVYT